MLGVLAIAAAQHALRQWIAMDAAHFAAALTPLDGKSVLIQLQSPRMALLLTVDNATLGIEPYITGHRSSSDFPSGLFEPTPAEMAQHTTPLYTPAASATLYLNTLVEGLKLLQTNLGESGNVSILGDLSVVQKLADAFKHAQPDVGSLLQPYLGDSVAEAAHTLVGSTLQQLRRYTQTARLHATEWIQEDNTVLAKRWQFEQFKQRVAQMHTRIDRLGATHANLSLSPASTSNNGTVAPEAFSPNSAS